MIERFKHAAAKIVFYAIGYTPLIILHFFGFLIGSLVFILPIRLRYYASANISLCFPKLSFLKHQCLLFKSLCETGKGLFEAPVFWVRSQAKLNALVKQVTGFELLEEALLEGKGLILLGSHLGAYYLANAFIAPRLSGITWIYKPQKGLVEMLTAQLRSQFGARFVPTSPEGVRELYRALRKGNVIGLSCDHSALDSAGVFAPYFNIPVSTMTLAPRLAAKSKSPVFFMVMERLKNARGYHLHIHKFGKDIYATDIKIAATAMNKMLEEAIRQFPEQNEWLYRRFWDRPEGELPLYKTQLKQ